MQILEFRVAVCSLPGDRHGSTRRSLVADMGEFIIIMELLYYEKNLTQTYYCSETLKKEGVTDIFVLCTDAELRQ